MPFDSTTSPPTRRCPDVDGRPGRPVGVLTSAALRTNRRGVGGPCAQSRTVPAALDLKFSLYRVWGVVHGVVKRWRLETPMTCLLIAPAADRRRGTVVPPVERRGMPTCYRLS